MRPEAPGQAREGWLLGGWRGDNPEYANRIRVRFAALPSGTGVVARLTAIRRSQAFPENGVEGGGSSSILHRGFIGLWSSSGMRSATS